MAANTGGPVSREQVKAGLAEAQRTGNMAYGESGARMNEIFPHNYPAQQDGASIFHTSLHENGASPVGPTSRTAENTTSSAYDENGNPGPVQARRRHD